MSGGGKNVLQQIADPVGTVGEWTKSDLLKDISKYESQNMLMGGLRTNLVDMASGKSWDDTMGKSLRNTEKGWANHFQDWGMLFKGNINNAGASFLKNVSMQGGVDEETSTALAGDKTTTERYIAEQEVNAKNKAANEASADVQTKADELNRQVSGLVAGLSSQKKMAPGRSQTLLGANKRGTNTLLTLIGTK